MKNSKKKQGFTPRQRCALAFPVMDTRDLHPRFYRVNAPFQSILTFDLHTVPDDEEIEGLETRDGKVGMWHGRVTKFPEAPLVQWSKEDLQKARVMARRLVKGVGREAYQIKDSKDGMAIRVFRWGTISEVAMALRSREGKNTK